MNYTEEQTNELEALKAIYSEELSVFLLKPYPKFTISVKSDPQNSDSETDEFSAIIYEVMLGFTLCDTYPDSIPDIEIQESVNLDDSDEQELLDLLVSEAEKSIGMVMTFTLVSVAIDWINRLSDHKKKEMKDQKERKKLELEEAERKKFEGTRVTVESFLTWRSKFDEEVNKLDKNFKNKEEINKKLSGRQLFEQNKSLIESDLQFLDEALDDQEFDTDVKVDETLFQELEDLDLEDDENERIFEIRSEEIATKELNPKGKRGQNKRKDSKESCAVFADHINDLNDYVFIEIFSYFSFVERIYLSRVCLKWKAVIETTFKSETVLNVRTVGTNMISEKAICLLIRKSGAVRHIDLNLITIFESHQKTEDESGSADNLIASLASNCLQLESIDFGDYERFDRLFERNAQYFRRLKAIKSFTIGERALNCIIDSPNLHSIDISANLSIFGTEFRRLGPNISLIHLSDSKAVNESAIRGLCEGNGRQLKCLSITISDENVLELICENLKQLNWLKINFKIRTFDFKRFSNLKQLKGLDIQFDPTLKTAFSAEDFYDLMESLKSLQLFELKIYLSAFNTNAINDNSVQYIPQYCHSIRTLVISRALILSGAGIQYIAQLAYIKHLNLMNSKAITDEIIGLINGCPLLRELILQNCCLITEQTVEAFIYKSRQSLKEQFYLDVMNTKVCKQSILQKVPKNLKLLIDFEDCI